MYGTIARVHVKPGLAAKFRQFAEREAEWASIPGFVFHQVYQMAADPTEYMYAVGFVDKAAYVANADRPEQIARYQEFRALLTADPEWHDGEIISTYPAPA
jgi:heme-degrading monooxygenase HmoA